jgi:shikimate dehydrogenase
VSRVALLGYPVGHSRSPAMHNAAFQALGLDWSYEAIEVEPDRFAARVRDLVAAGYAGANVTIPHKLAALELADRASEVARAAGAANTLVFRSGEIEGDNTDAAGFLEALRERAPEAPAEMRCLVLGAGGAARAVVHALLAEGAAGVEVWNRHPERAGDLVRGLGGGSAATRLHAVPEPTAAKADLIVNATSVGMPKEPEPDRPGEGGGLHDFKDLPLSADELRDRQVLVDLTYRDGDTALVREARARGLRCADGLDVLVHQGAASFELWTGRAAPLEAMRDGARKRERSR